MVEENKSEIGNNVSVVLNEMEFISAKIQFKQQFRETVATQATNGWLGTTPT